MTPIYDLLLQSATYLNKNMDFETGHLIVHQGVIEKILPLTESPPQCKDNLNAKQYLVFPGLINAHTHLPMVLFRGLGDGFSLSQWLNEIIFPLEKNWTPEEIYISSMVGIAELLRSGCTCFADMYFHVEQIARAVDESGIRACLSLGLTMNDQKKGLLQSEQLFLQYHLSSEGRIQIHLAPHAIYTCPPDYMKDIIALSRQIDATIHIHINETLQEIKQHMEIYQQFPVETLHDIGLFERAVLAAHCTHLNHRETAILKNASRLLVVHNPSSNMKLASGIAPVEWLRKEHVCVGIGTDGAASNNNLNMFMEMRITSLLSKIAQMDATSLTAKETIQMASSIPGKFLRGDSYGTIQEKAPADLIFLDFNHAHCVPVHDALSNLVYAMNGSEVNTVIVNGKIVMKDKIIQTFDEQFFREQFISISKKYLNISRRKIV